MLIYLHNLHSKSKTKILMWDKTMMTIRKWLACFVQSNAMLDKFNFHLLDVCSILSDFNCSLNAWRANSHQIDTPRCSYMQKYNNNDHGHGFMIGINSHIHIFSWKKSNKKILNKINGSYPITKPKKHWKKVVTPIRVNLAGCFLLLSSNQPTIERIDFPWCSHVDSSNANNTAIIKSNQYAYGCSHHQATSATYIV